MFFLQCFFNVTFELGSLTVLRQPVKCRAKEKPKNNYEIENIFTLRNLSYRSLGISYGFFLDAVALVSAPKMLGG